MDRDTLRAIRKLQVSAPVNVVGIARYLGLAVWEDENLPAGISGKIFRDVKHGGAATQYSIIIRAQDPTVRKRFTVAHELGHYILHRHIFKDLLMDDAMYRSGLGGRVEAQANGLAADILMPWHLLSPLSDKSIPELARIFQVSEDAMGIRLGRSTRSSPMEFVA